MPQNPKFIVLCIVVVIILVVLAGGLGRVILQSRQNQQTDYDEVTYEANGFIQEFVNSKEYLKANREERIELTRGFLEDLERKRYITGLYFDEINNLFSFHFVNGTLGGIYIKDFSRPPGSLPMD